MTDPSFRTLADSLPALVWWADPEGACVYANRTWVEFTGLPLAEHQGDRWIEPIHPEDVSRFLEIYRSAVQRREPFILEYRLRRHDGVYRWILDRGAPCHAPDGRLIGFVGSATDVTHCRILQEHLYLAQKIEAIGQLAAGVGHHFNNLLTVVKGYAELLLNLVPPDSKEQTFLREIRDSANKGAALTRQLLLCSQRLPHAPVVIDLNSVVIEADQILRQVLGEDLELITQLEPHLGLIHADPAHLQQIMLNLAVNARDAMPDGGRLMIRTANVEISAEQGSLDHLPSGRYVQLVVSDTGCGMTADVLAHLFEPFFTTKEVGQGTGLGLASVYAMVRQAGGYIRVESQPGRGSSFALLFPRAEPPATPPPASVPPPVATLHGSETVLLVEDDPEVRQLTQTILQLHGYTVLAARHGNEAIARVHQHSGPIHALLTDVVMPEMSGPELARRLLAQLPDLRVVYFSGHSTSSLLRYGVGGGTASYLAKPFTPESLLTRVRDVLDR